VIYLLDTDHLSVLQRGGQSSHPLVRRLRNIGHDDYGTTIVSHEEQCRGWANFVHKAQTPQDRLESYGQLRNNLRFFCAIAVLDYTDTADALVRTWQTAKIRVGIKDLRIAAITLSSHATLLTRNSRDFEKVPGLRTDDWTI